MSDQKEEYGIIKCCTFTDISFFFFLLFALPCTSSSLFSNHFSFLALNLSTLSILETMCLIPKPFWYDDKCCCPRWERLTGYENISIVVTKMGWPSVDAIVRNEEYANKRYAEMYLKGLVKHLKSDKGTPLRKEERSGVCLWIRAIWWRKWGKSRIGSTLREHPINYCHSLSFACCGVAGVWEKTQSIISG